MKTLGLLGGMSWESTSSYYQLLNQGVQQKLGGLHSAKICLHSFDFAEIEALQMRGAWYESGQLMLKAAQNLEKAGAEGLLICTNTMHKLAEVVQQGIAIPLIHIADSTAKQLIKDGIQHVGLLGTKFTMEEDFYTSRLEQSGLKVYLPDQQGREVIHRVIYDELCLGQTRDESRKQYVEIVQKLKASGAEAVILGCTEIALLLKPDDVDVPLYDTTAIHAQAAVDFACE